MDPEREGYDDPLNSSVERESVEYSCKSCVACTDLAIFSATQISLGTVSTRNRIKNLKKKKQLTKSHKLRSNSNRKHNQV